MGLLEVLFGNPKPNLKCDSGGQCDLTRIKIMDGKSAEQYRWRCNKCLQEYFYCDSYLNGKKISAEDE